MEATASSSRGSRELGERMKIGRQICQREKRSTRLGVSARYLRKQLTNSIADHTSDGVEATDDWVSLCHTLLRDVMMFVPSGVWRKTYGGTGIRVSQRLPRWIHRLASFARSPRNFYRPFPPSQTPDTLPKLRNSGHQEEVLKNIGGETN